MIIRLLRENEEPPWNLLLLADPSKELVSGSSKRYMLYCSIGKQRGRSSLIASKNKRYS